MTPDTSETYRGLYYPFGRKPDIQPGQPVKVAEGVYWVRFVMPIALDHINLWLLEDGDGWTVVDTCLNIDSARDTWEQLFSGFMQGKPIKRVICTHLHPDHVGLAGWLCERFDADLWMSREEFLMCRTMAADTGKQAPPVALRFYRAAGWDEERLAQYKQKFGAFGRAIYPLPESFRRLINRETITIGDHYWQAIVGRGHSPEHIALYCPGLKLLISGDQILPRISPNVSVFPTEPMGDPLKEWLRSQAVIRDILPDDLLVLPAHEAPFHGLYVRLSQLIEGHKRDLVTLFNYLDQPRRAVDCFPALFSRKMEGSDVHLATGETLAHLNCLLGRHRITRTRDENGVDWYQQIPETADFDE
ncbi:MBL fold metallo-hydrolase [Seongchinamella sediminis]|uniref:MBL fold metallo-hydrolase n=1 Tax=Seongchinamella sediminis TaxID=2283635 RepID=A0A3L7E4J9_9GAMM|nr:MBL fold metallo-hydrolase [Seongchinamella sediminis]RLQ23392.1 MBL fold metallo-hydrolase [Seongchinamella sediminis]